MEQNEPIDQVFTYYGEGSVSGSYSKLQQALEQGYRVIEIMTVPLNDNHYRCCTTVWCSKDPSGRR